MKFYIAQINIARLIAPIDDPRIAEFVNRLDEINAIADQSKGFVWRLQDDQGDALSFNPFNDPMIITNMSVWESIDDLKQYVYRSGHVNVFMKRQEWFVKMQEEHLALWWVEPTHIPDVEEGKERLFHLRKYGPTSHAFSFKQLHEPQIGNSIKKE